MKLHTTLALIVPLIVPALGNAGIVGDQVDIQGCYPDTAFCGTLATPTVTADASDAVAYGLATIDVNDISITLSASAGYATGPGIFNGFRVLDIDWVGEPGRIISGFAITSNTFAAFSESDVSYTADSISLNLGNDGGAGTAVIELQTTVVPLPAGALLFLSALSGLSFAGFRSRSAAAA